MIPLGGSEFSLGVGLLAIVGTTGLLLLGATDCFSIARRLKMLIFQVTHSECTVCLLTAICLSPQNLMYDLYQIPSRHHLLVHGQ